MKVACVLGPMFEDSEFKDPYDALRAAGHDVTIVGLKTGEVLEGSKHKTQATVEKAFADVRPDDFQGLLIPGGSSPDKLRAHDEAVEFVKAFMTAGKPTFAICHGPQLLLTANEYMGHKMTAWKTVREDLEKAGADTVDAEVVVDRNLVTSRMPADIPAFIRKSLEVLEQVPAPR